MPRMLKRNVMPTPQQREEALAKFYSLIGEIFAFELDRGTDLDSIDIFDLSELLLKAALK